MERPITRGHGALLLGLGRSVMERPITRGHVALLLGLGLLSAACGGLEAPRQPEAGRAARTVHDEGLRFEPPVLELGLVVPAGFVDGRALVRNVSAGPVEIVDYSADCDCTNAAPDLPRTLRPGEAFSFPVRLDLGNLPDGGLGGVDEEGAGTVERALALWTSVGRSVELRLRAEVSEQLEVEPSVVNLGELMRGERGQAKVVLRPGRGREDEPVSLLSARALGAGPQLPVSELRRGRELELGLELPPQDRVGPVRSEWELLTDAMAAPVRILLRAEVVEPLLVVPTRIDVPAAAPGQPVQSRIQLRRRDGLPLEVESVHSTSGQVLVERLGPNPAGTQVVHVVAVVPPWPAQSEAEVVIQTDFPGPRGRLEVPVRVRSMPPR